MALEQSRGRMNAGFLLEDLCRTRATVKLRKVVIKSARICKSASVPWKASESYCVDQAIQFNECIGEDNRPIRFD
jgi:hypothetical protein